ncbi:hypothetical protein LSAT2_030075, partial [Lamellibrachia satsuma]
VVVEDVRYVTKPFRVDDDDDDGYTYDVENWNSECDVTATRLQHCQAWQRVMADVRCRRQPVMLIDRRGRHLARIYIPPRDNAAH